jgi:plastocyanin
MLLRLVCLAVVVCACYAATVTIDAGGVNSMSFSPAVQTINIGDTVIWNNLENHNVAQVAGSDSIDYLTGGIKSGEPNTVSSFKYTFSNKTQSVYYFVCQVHVQCCGMRFQLNVNTGSGNLVTTAPRNSGSSSNEVFYIYVLGLTVLYVVLSISAL